MKKSSGFTLIELLIYISLLAGIALATSSWVVHIWGSFMRQSKQGSLLMAMHCAHDVMLRDMRTAPKDRAAWKKIDSATVVWKAAHNDIGYIWDGTTLTRIEGNFDECSDEWHSTTKSVLLKPIEKLFFAVHGTKKNIQWIEFTLEMAGVHIFQSVSLTQREFS